MNRMYKATPDGYCGDEDNGQTSAWYVFSTMRFYPVCSASDQYVLGVPMFKKITINLENGKNVIINAPANTAESKYISRLRYNGLINDKNWLIHSKLMRAAAPGSIGKTV
jgi:putative alpha-1,2-mannosidase